VLEGKKDDEGEEGEGEEDNNEDDDVEDEEEDHPKLHLFFIILILLPFHPINCNIINLKFYYPKTNFYYPKNNKIIL
jgi:HrpA-like RNA helicase